MHLVKQVDRELRTEPVAHLVSFVRTCSVSQSSEFSQDQHRVLHLEQVRNYLPVLLLLLLVVVLLAVGVFLLLLAVLLVVVVLLVLLVVLLVLSLHLCPYHHLY